MKDRDYLGTEGVCPWVGKLVATDYHENGTFTEKHCKITGQNGKEREGGVLLETGGSVLCGYLFLYNEATWQDACWVFFQK